VSLAAGFVVAVVLARTVRPGGAAFSLALGLCLAVTFLLSKQAFLNYYLVCASYLLLAAWSRAEDGVSPSPETGMPPAHDERTAYLVARGGAEAPVSSGPQ
jgi:threonine/homoserine/homoserine lactone efflux protein